jgi:hypothetical protein
VIVQAQKHYQIFVNKIMVDELNPYAANNDNAISPGIS